MATILGIDLGKTKSVACSYDPQTQEATFATIPTDPDALRSALERLRPGLVVFEACTVAGWLADICRESGLKFLVANTMSEAWSWRKVKRKTDRDDARKLARMAALGELPAVHVPSPEARQYRGLVAYRDKLTGRRTALQNHIRALCQSQGLALPPGHRAWTAAGRVGTTSARARLDQSPDVLLLLLGLGRRVHGPSIVAPAMRAVLPHVVPRGTAVSTFHGAVPRVRPCPKRGTGTTLGPAFADPSGGPRSFSV
jgi:transposase